MSRHRDIRNMDYSDDYDGYDDVYGHSIDDDYCISPSNRQYLYNREHSTRSSEGDIKEENEENSAEYLCELEKNKLTSCLEQVQNVLGQINLSKEVIKETAVAQGFDAEKTVDELLKNPGIKQEKTVQGQQVTEEAVTATIVVASTPKTTLNVTKGFELPTRSASPSARDASPVKKESKPSARELYEKERGKEKDHLYMVIIGHVDAGKSTLMGRMLCELGQVNQRVMHKYEQESRKLGKQSFVYAWVLDETGEERNRGITMDVGRFQFETKTKNITLLDAPGHKDFIPNMISGACQADVALLVVDATRGEFETGFDYGGQTREHALLVRSLGVTQLAVAINKLDTVSWSQERFIEIEKKLRGFLKQAGFKENDVTYVPCSGLTGQNLACKPTENELVAWYNGPCLLEVIDNFKSPERPVSKPFRLSVNDIFKGTGTNFCVSGRVETGILSSGDRILICPNRDYATVKSLSIEDIVQSVVFAGDQVVVTLSGIEMQHMSVGNILCDPQQPVPVASKFQARIVVFNVTVPITRGYPVVLHHQSLTEPVVVAKLISQLNKSTGEVIKKHPRFLGNNTSAIVEIHSSRPLALELYAECKELGRIMLRVNGVTIAAGLVCKIIL